MSPTTQSIDQSINQCIWQYLGEYGSKLTLIRGALLSDPDIQEVAAIDDGARARVQQLTRRKATFMNQLDSEAFLDVLVKHPTRYNRVSITELR